MKGKKRSANRNRIYLFLLVVAVLFMNIGYALINSVSLSFAADVLVDVQRNIFISSVDIKSDLSTNPDLNNTKVNSAYQTMLNTDVGLSSTNPNSTVVMEVTIHNGGDCAVLFDEITTDGTTSTYSNENIVYALSGLNRGDQLLPSESVTFTITFSYKDGVLPNDGNYLLESCLNFKFSDFFTVTYDANGGSFESGTTNGITYVKRMEEITRISKTSNVSDDGLTFDSTGYGNNQVFTDVITISGAENLEVTITYATESATYDWVAIYDGTVTPSASNYSSSISGKLGGKTQTTKTYTLTGDTVQIFFKSDSSVSNYYGYYATVKGTGTSTEILAGEYIEPTHEIEYMAVEGWYTDVACTEGNEVDLNTLTSSTTVYAKWKDARINQAIYSSTDSSFRFLYDIPYSAGDTFVDQDGNSKVATAVYTGFESAVYSKAPWYSNGSNIVKVVVEDEIKPISTAYWFQSFTNAESFDLSKLNASEVINMEYMFNDAGKNVDNFSITGLSSWDVSNVTDMSRMFNSAGNNATTFNIGDLSDWDVSNVTDMSNMFYGSASTTSVLDIGDLSGWDVSNVTDMGWMFGSFGDNATTFNIGDLGDWDVSKVTDMSYMFSYAGWHSTEFNIGDLSNWDVSSVTDMSHMFLMAWNEALVFDIGDLGGWDVSSVTDMSYMFRLAGEEATTWSLGDLSNWDVSSVTDMSYMFYWAGYNVETWNIGNLNAWNVSNVTDMSGMFSSAGSSATTFNIGDLGGWDVSNVTDMSEMFNSAGRYSTTFNIGDLGGWNVSNVTDMSRMFSTGSSATTWYIGDLSDWDVSNVTDMSSMFSIAGGRSTTFNIGDLSNWDVSNVTGMGWMFYGSGGRSTTFNIGDLSGWDVSNVTDMENMFGSAGDNATAFNLGDLSGWDVSNVTDMSGMFSSAGRYSTTFNIGDLSSWDVSNVTDMESMFENAGQSASYYMNLSGWTVTNVSNSTDFNLNVETKVIAPTFPSTT